MPRRDVGSRCLGVVTSAKSSCLQYGVGVPTSRWNLAADISCMMPGAIAHARQIMLSSANISGRDGRLPFLPSAHRVSSSDNLRVCRVSLQTLRIVSI